MPLVRQAALTTTKVPWFNGSTRWEQYLQVFDAIVLSNGWGDATAALQLLSHLQDDALSVALLIPMPLQASRKELTDALFSHYGSPGRLANYRREFDKTVRKRGEDPSNFAITLSLSPIGWRQRYGIAPWNAVHGGRTALNRALPRCTAKPNLFFDGTAKYKIVCFRG